MTALHLSDILDHWVVGRARGLLGPNGTASRISQLPPHLVDDVDARGFPRASVSTGSESSMSLMFLRDDVLKRIFDRNS
jgi:hypothetical protein